jgi:capsular exopolysaccharide synthesis family protein
MDVERAIRLLAVSSALPEEGKSTVAASLALAYHTSGRRTMLLETDLRRPSLTQRLGLPPALGLSDYLSGAAEYSDVLQEVLVPHASGGNGQQTDPMACITAGTPRAEPSALLRSSRFLGLLRRLAGDYDVVILDTAPLLSVVDTREMLPYVDGILLCVRSSQTTREQVASLRTTLDRLPRRPTGLVVTGLSARELGAYGYYPYEYAETPAG